ncbi:MAG: recombinase family protein [Burkholderiales bacterium]|nr:recombinase family protein [Burkholderiales bacterium]
MASSNKVFGYIRVSTQKQGREGVSLEAQRDAISRYAASRGLEIVEWIEDQESAAKQGRTGFTRMVGLLRRGKASGFICHKLDRSVRNIYDWSELNRLVDQGAQIHFAHESLDLDSLSGKLSADIQAAIAAHYSRNLRDEVRKGMIGRLKQGYLPFTAPRGYLNCGAGKPKEIDPVVGPLIRKLFELYATGDYGFQQLREEMAKHGLTTSNGKMLALDTLTIILNNTFYYGVITVKRTGESYVGNHTPLITRALFMRCQDILHKRIRRRSMRFDHTFRRRIRCGTCERHLIGETQKGHIYYRCHSFGCKGVSLREETVIEALRQEMCRLAPVTQFSDFLCARLAERKAATTLDLAARRKQLTMQIDAINSRQGALVDMHLDGIIDKETFKAKAQSLVDRAADLRRLLSEAGLATLPMSDPARVIVELKDTLEMLRNCATAREARLYVDRIVSNLSVQGKKPYITYVSPLPFVVEQIKKASGGGERDQTRTFEELCRVLDL